MKAVRIYQPGIYHTGQILELSAGASQHVGVVLRMQVGEKLTLFCGDNREFDATIELLKKKQVHVLIGAIKVKSRESPLSIHLAQAISKGDRMDFVMQKAVELGVASIRPLITERCVVKLDRERMEKRVSQWQSMVIAACEQSGRNTVPMVYQPIHLEHYLQESLGELKLILHPGTNKNWRELIKASSSIALLIGPEGGFSEQEVQLVNSHGFQAMSLGPRILRTETAAITALGVLQAVAGDL